MLHQNAGGVCMFGKVPAKRKFSLHSRRRLCQFFLLGMLVFYVQKAVEHQIPTCCLKTRKWYTNLFCWWYKPTWCGMWTRFTGSALKICLAFKGKRMCIVILHWLSSLNWDFPVVMLIPRLIMNVWQIMAALKKIWSQKKKCNFKIHPLKYLNKQYN